MLIKIHCYDKVFDSTYFGREEMWYLSVVFSFVFVLDTL